jgi:hypothetical protein
MREFKQTIYFILFKYSKFRKGTYVILVAFQDGNRNIPLSRAFVYELVGSVNMEEGCKYDEGCGLEGPIRCIFLCEFHPKAGPKITCQVWPKVKYTFPVSLLMF